MKVLILFLALLISWIVLMRTVNIITSKRDKHMILSFLLEILACLLWTVFYLLKDY